MARVLKACVRPPVERTAPCRSAQIGAKRCDLNFGSITRLPLLFREVSIQSHQRLDQSGAPPVSNNESGSALGLPEGFWAAKKSERGLGRHVRAAGSLGKTKNQPGRQAGRHEEEEERHFAKR